MLKMMSVVDVVVVDDVVDDDVADDNVVDDDSFIHSGDLYSASSRDYYSEALPAQPRTKKDLREM